MNAKIDAFLNSNFNYYLGAFLILGIAAALIYKGETQGYDFLFSSGRHMGCL